MSVSIIANRVTPARLHDGSAAAKVEARLVALLGGARQYGEFCRALQTSGAVISGSFVLQCLIDATWAGSDIDVFVPVQPNAALHPSAYTAWTTSHLDTWLCANGATMWKKGKVVHAFYDQFTHKQHTLTYIRNYAFRGAHVQMIYTTRATTADVCALVVQDFDFSILKNCFFVDADGVAQCTVYSAGDIERRQCRFETHRNVRSSLARRIKYTERGFKFTERDARIWLPQLVAADRYLHEFSTRYFHGGFLPEPRLVNFAALYAHNEQQYRTCKQPQYCPYCEISAHHVHGLQTLDIDPITYDVQQLVTICAALQSLLLPTLVLLKIVKIATEPQSRWQPRQRLWRWIDAVRVAYERTPLRAGDALIPHDGTVPAKVARKQSV